jgi:hypothetical protein
MNLQSLTRRPRLWRGVSLLLALALIGGISYIGVRTINSSSALTPGKAALRMEAASGTAVTGATIPVTIKVDSATTAVSTVRAFITYPAAQLQVVGITNGSALPTAQRSTQGSGTIDIIRAISGGSPGVSGSNTVVTIHFKVIGTTGTIPLSFSSNSEAYDSSGTGTNVIDLASTTGATYTFASSTAAIYRFWSPFLRHHMLTADSNEAEHIKANYPANIWTYEGVAFRVKATAGCAANETVHRFYSEPLKTHLYTMDEYEKSQILAKYPSSVWRYEGVAYCASPTQTAGTKPVQRFYSEVIKSHLYTLDENEANHIRATYPPSVWRYEGTAYYATPN